MGAVVVRYTTRPDRADENEQLIREVFAELAAADPGGVEYTALRLDDGISFVHVAVLEGDGNPLLALEAFQRFSSTVGERCADGPHPARGAVIGSYPGHPA